MIGSFPPTFLEGDPEAPVCADGACALPGSTPSRMAAPSLFAPAAVGGLRLRNRFALAPMGRNRSPGGVPDTAMADYYAARVRDGGVGLVFTEATGIDHPSVGDTVPTRPRLRPGVGEAGHAGLAEAVHAAGGAVVMQLWHPGAHDLGPAGEAAYAARSPSGHWPVSGAHGGALSVAEIDAVVAAFADAAALAKALGYDGVEVHGAHGFLIDQFLWPVTNRRTDGYGGAPANRARFATEVVAVVRAATGPDFPVTFRVSQWKSRVKGSRLVDDAEALAAILDPIAAAGPDLFHVSVHRYDEAAFAGSDLTLAGWVRRLTGKPVVTVGSVGLDRDDRPDPGFDFAALERLLAAGEFDLVAIGRALLEQPDWLARQGTCRAAGSPLSASS